jgi:hypothetical protein
MKWILFFSLFFSVSCASRPEAQLAENSSDQNLTKAIVATPTPIKSEIKSPSKNDVDSDLCKEYQDPDQPGKVPKTDSPIGKFDFKNFTYPKIWQKGFVKLKDGCFGEMITEPGLAIEIYTLNSVDFVDFNNDGVDEALIKVAFFSGSGSSGVSENYLLYNLKGKKLNLLWKIGTGVRAYCGTKEYELKDKQIILELFGKCSVKSDGNFDDTGKHTYDYSAFEYTRFVFGMNDNRFGVKSREVLPFPEQDIKDYFNRKFNKQNENGN